MKRKQETKGIVFPYNPFKYIPQIGVQLKRCDKNSEEYISIMKKLLKSKGFMHVLMDNIVSSSDEFIIKERKPLNEYSDMSSFFLKVSFIGTVASVILYTGIAGPLLAGYAKYSLAASLLAFPFALYAGGKAGNHVSTCIDHYLDDYKLPSPRFTLDMMRRMVLIECTGMDFMNAETLKLQIPCGCYSCKGKFSSEKISLCTDGEQYKCPLCGAATVISERCGFEINDELLNDMHEYWLE